MFSQYCSGCLTKEHCFENGYCLKQKFEEDYDAEDNIAEVSDLTEQEQWNDRIMRLQRSDKRDGEV